MIILRFCLLAIPLLLPQSARLQAQSFLVGRPTHVLGDQPGQEFGKVTGIELAADGRMFVSDVMASTIHVFSADGAYAGRWGRPGRGPGDLDAPLSIVSDSARNVLWILHVDGHVAFDLGTGRYRHQIRLPTPRRAPPLVADDGRIRIVARMSGERVHVTVDSTGTVLDVVRLPPPPPEDSVGSPQWAGYPHSSGRTIEVQVPVPFGPRELLAARPSGGFARALSSAYLISVHGSDGARTTTIRRPADPVPVSPGEARAALQRLDSLALGTRGGGYFPEYTIPRFKPVLKAMWYDRDDRLWVERSVADGADSEADIYDGTGEFLFTASWPSDIALREGAIRGRTAIGIRTDALGVDTVVRLEFAAGSPE